MLAEIDRTSRLNPLMEPTMQDAMAAAPTADPELPFASLPRAGGRAALDWTAAIRALSGEAPGETRRPAIERASADPDVAALIELTREVAAALAEDGLYLSDLAPVHCPAALWARFAAGERGGDIVGLAGVEDDVALAIARTRLRDDTASGGRRSAWSARTLGWSSGRRPRSAPIPGWSRWPRRGPAAPSSCCPARHAPSAPCRGSSPGSASGAERRLAQQAARPP